MTKVATVPKIKVEKGVAFPKYGTRLYPFAEMEIGDSFVLPTKPLGLYASARYQGIKIAVRKTEDGYRIWRIA